MPAHYQSGTDSSEYDSSAHRQVDEWPDEWLLNLYPMTDDAAARYLKAAQDLNASADVQQHFFACL